MRFHVNYSLSTLQKCGWTSIEMRTSEVNNIPTCGSQSAVHLPWHGVSVVPQLDRAAKVTELNQP